MKIKLKCNECNRVVEKRKPLIGKLNLNNFRCSNCEKVSFKIVTDEYELYGGNKMDYEEEEEEEEYTCDECGREYDKNKSELINFENAEISICKMCIKEKIEIN